MNSTVVVVGVIAFFSLVSSVLVVFALARSSQCSRQDETMEQDRRRAWGAEPRGATVRWDKRPLVPEELFFTSKGRSANTSQDFSATD